MSIQTFFSLVMRSCVFVVVVGCLVSAVSRAEGDCRATIGDANVNFVPGDAFFSASLTEQDLATLAPAVETLELDYRLPRSVRSFGGHFGYSVLRLNGLAEEFGVALKRECAWLRNGHPLQFVRIANETDEVLRELNPIRVLVYDAGFNTASFRIGLRYNEHWNHKSHTAKTRLFGRSSKIIEHGVVPYVAFTITAGSVVEDWKNGANVPGLDVFSSEESFDPFLMHDSKSEGTAIVKGSCKLFLLEPVPVNDYFLQMEGLRFVELSLNGEAKRFIFVRDGKIKSVSPGN